MKKRILSFLTLMCMFAALLPTNIVTVSAYTGTKYGDYLYYTVSDDEVAITHCDSSATDIVIPSTIDGKKVTSINYEAFKNCSSLTSITIPDSVTSIAHQAFQYCSSLTSITIPDSVTNIGYNVFWGCSDVTSITIGNGVTNLGENAFYQTSFYDNESNWDNDVLYIGNYLIDAKKTLSGKYTIKNGTKCIGGYAFCNCDSVTSITIPDSVTSISSSAFAGCSKVTSMSIPNGVTSISRGTFEGCTGLTSITLPGGITSIGDYAFMGCSSLTSITIPDSVTSIGEIVFKNCTDLTSISVGNSITSIGDNAFYNTGFYNNESNWNNDVLYIGNHLIKAKELLSGKYTVKNGTKCIGSKAFYSCGITSISIPDSVIGISYDAFVGCRLNSVNITDIAAWCNIKFDNDLSNPIKRAQTLYIDDNLVTDLVIPDSVTSIGDYAFVTCRSMTGITIPNKVTHIGEGAFFYCDKLKNVYYNGTETDWNKILISDYNTHLTDVTRTYFAYIHIFDKDGNKVIDTMHNMGESIDLSNIEISGGYIITKLYKDKAMTKEYSLDTPINENLSLYAELVKFEGTKTTISEDGKTFTVKPINIANGNMVILALYNGDTLVETQKKSYSGETIPFTTNKTYTTAKVMVWNNLDEIVPICNAEHVKMN